MPSQSPASLAEDAIVDLFAGRCTRPEAIARIQTYIGLTEAGATDLIDHPTAPGRRYENARAQVLRQMGSDG